MIETLISSSVLIVVLALLRLALRGRIRPGLRAVLRRRHGEDHGGRASL